MIHLVITKANGLRMTLNWLEWSFFKEHSKGFKNGRKWRKFIELTLVLFDDVENKNKTSFSNLSIENTRLTKWLFKYKSLIIRRNKEIKEMEKIKDGKHVILTIWKISVKGKITILEFRKLKIRF